MKCVFKKIALALTLSIGLSVPAKPLSETAAMGWSVAGGVVVGGLAAGGTYVITDGMFQSDFMRYLVTGVVGAGAGALTWKMIYGWLYAKTPTAKVAAASILINTAAMNMTAAENQLMKLMQDKVVTKKFATDADFIANVNARFGTSWPLVLARDYLTGLPNALRSLMSDIKSLVGRAQGPLQDALAEMRSSGGYGTILVEAERLEKSALDLLDQAEMFGVQIVQLAELIEAPLTTLVQHEKFDFQVGLREKHLEEQRRREHEEAEARRRRAHELQMQERDHAHDHAERFSDRWHDSSERSKDRFSTAFNNERKYQHQNNVLRSNPYRPVSLNVG